MRSSPMKEDHLGKNHNHLPALENNESHHDMLQCRSNVSKVIHQHHSQRVLKSNLPLLIHLNVFLLLLTLKPVPRRHHRHDPLQC